MSLLLLFGGGPPPAVLPETLTTFAANRHGPLQFLSSELLEVAKNNAQALALGATGANMTADLTVSAGHTHESADTRLSWRQICTHPLHNNEANSIGAAPDECYDAVLIDSTTPINLASVRLWLSAVEAGDVIPRLRASNDNSATTDCTVTFTFYDLSFSVIATYNLVFSTATLRDRVWVDGVTQDLSAAPVDVDVATRQPVIVYVSGALTAATENVAIHEISFGVTP